jgi:predicted XRE-type DNA-binding protein
MRRSRQALAQRGGKLAQVRLDAAGKRGLAALELITQAASAGDAIAAAAEVVASRHRFPLRLSRDQEMEIARLALGPWTAARFRSLGHADAFMAGIAIALAGDRDLPRATLLAVAREIAPHVVEEEGYRRWLDATPLTLPRLVKLVRTERAIAAAHRFAGAARGDNTTAKVSNVWDALANTPAQAAKLALRSELLRDLQALISASKWTQAQAAKRCGLSQRRINDLMRGRISKFSLDALVNIAGALGRRVHLELRAA